MQAGPHTLTLKLAAITFAAAWIPGAAAAEDKAVRPFVINVSDADLADLQDRLSRTRWPEKSSPRGWQQGVELTFMQELVSHWRTDYDWRKWERKLNAFDQFKTEIDGLDIHFIHQRSPHPDALPLVIVHGWPGSVVEFHKIIGPLTDPEKHGGKAEDAFHVVAPSLPGFGFSEAPDEPGWSASRMAAVIADLMARLGYEKYGAQGGDWGAGITRWLGTYDSDHVTGVHTNFPGGTPPAGTDRWKGVSDAERERLESRRAELANHKAYAAIQGTRPDTIGFALNDTPAGLAAWIIDKFRAWSDHRGDLENSFTKDELITNIMIYWITGSASTSARIYFEREHYTGGRAAGAVPVGVALFPKEINVPPRKWIEARYGDRLIHFTAMPRGGHFAGMEEPGLLVEDIRAFFGKLR